MPSDSGPTGRLNNLCTGSFLESVIFLFCFISTKNDIGFLFVIVKYLMNNHSLLGNFFLGGGGLRTTGKIILKSTNFPEYNKRNKV